MSEILQYKTIKSADKEEFDGLVTQHLKFGWELVTGGYSHSDGFYNQVVVWKKKNSTFDNTVIEFAI